MLSVIFLGGTSFLTSNFWLLKAGTGIAELIALEISKQVKPDSCILLHLMVFIL